MRKKTSPRSEGQNKAAFAKVKRAVSTVLAFAMFIAQVPVPQVFAQGAPESSEGLPQAQLVEGLERNITEAQLEVLQDVLLERQSRGLIGFYGDYALPDGNAPVNVIVMFENSPAAVQVLEAQVDGYSLTLDEAEAIVEAEHELFSEEVEELLGNPLARTATYTIRREYRYALNGVAMTLPANQVAELAQLDSVRAIYPDGLVQAGPIDLVTLSEVFRNPPGMAPGRETMGADEMHQLGYRGEGIIISVLDTGVDFYHPAFPAESFLTIEEAMAINPDLTEADGLYGLFKGRNLIDESDPALGLNIPRLRPSNNPMETTYDEWRASGLPEFRGPNRFLTAHGTHVAGTIAGRDAGQEFSILGVAPEARMIHYRVLGPYGSGLFSDITAGVEYSVLDGADIINMSLGAPGANSATAVPTTMAVNHISLSHPEVVVVIAAGNSGSNYGTIGSPGVATTAITVANIAEAGNVGVVLEFGDVAIDSGFGSTPEAVASALRGEEFRLFTLPRLPGSPNPNPGPVPGAGTVAEFDALVASYGLEALQGAFVLIRRGHYFTDVAAAADAIGLAGVIAINHDNSAATGGIPELGLPYLFIGLEAGIELYASFGAADYLAFEFGDYVVSSFRLNISSSRGPVLESFEIKPDIGANGTNVLSAIPPWFLEGGSTDYTTSYGLMSGTSMAAPHVAGGVALMMQHSRETLNEEWTNEEIKVRIMNTAIPFEEGFYGIFDKGTGYMDVVAATFADALVYVTYDRVVTQLGVSFWGQDFLYARTGSFSFGPINTYDTDGGESRTLEAAIVNEASSARTFEISYGFITSGRQSRSSEFADLAFTATTLEVPAGGRVEFAATMTLEEGAPIGNYEGFVYVHERDTLIARLPFAAVGVELGRASLTDLYFYRPVIATGDAAINDAARQLGLIYTPHSGFGLNTWIFRYVEGLNETNWEMEIWDEYFVGFAGQFVAFDDALSAISLGQPHRAIIFEGSYLPTPFAGVGPVSGAQPQLLTEGDYLFVFEVHRYEAGAGFGRELDVIKPFSVDNTAPVVAVDDLNPDTGVLSLGQNEDGTVQISGNVFDAWLAQANEKGVTFDMFLASPVADQSFNAVWVEFGGHAVQAEVDAEGYFSVTITPRSEAFEVILTALDNYSVIPQIFSHLGGGSAWSWNAHPAFVRPNGLVLAHESLNPYLRLGGMLGFNPHPLFDAHVWSGLNAFELIFNVEIADFVDPGLGDGDGTAPVVVEVAYEWNVDQDFQVLSSQRGFIEPLEIQLTVPAENPFNLLTPVNWQWVRYDETGRTVQNAMQQQLQALGVNPNHPDWLTSFSFAPIFGHMVVFPWDPAFMDFNGDWNLYLYVGGELQFRSDTLTITVLEDEAFDHFSLDFTIYHEILHLREWHWPLDEIEAPMSGIIDFGQVPNTTSLTSGSTLILEWQHHESGVGFGGHTTLAELGIDLTDPNRLSAPIDPWAYFLEVLDHPHNQGFGRWLAGGWSFVVSYTDGRVLGEAFMYIDMELLPSGNVNFQRLDFEEWLDVEAGSEVEFVIGLNTDVAPERMVFRWFRDGQPHDLFFLGTQLDNLEEIRLNPQGVPFIPGVQWWDSGHYELIVWTYGLHEDGSIDFYTIETADVIGGTLNVDNMMGTRPIDGVLAELVSLLDNEVTDLLGDIAFILDIRDLEEAELRDLVGAAVWDEFHEAVEEAVGILARSEDEDSSGGGIVILNENTPLRYLEIRASVTRLSAAVRAMEVAIEALPAVELPVETYPEWNSSEIFDTGDRVTHNGRVFEAQWWTQNQEPGTSPWGAWMEIGSPVYFEGRYVLTWTDSNVFDNGDVVYYDGYFFRAQWWTRNQSPRTQWGPWQVVGARN